ncbi:DUF6428 family protein [Robiginitalea sp. M366]|uniref:DUF6428 family protein n=1 Tax=Robiginitalea aestuariiviva TaxID=3036903 RepID=UPI00240D4643|nr:DUF6428 family protein [Robiginitalea aestuariiviva]MDG1571200.1 DUF6428 family protein [Robiginitalea aestuariiviva]
MTTREFLQVLRLHPGKKLQFEYREGAQLRPDYHITEVKNVLINATDCGGRSDQWEETVIQLWEAPQPEPDHGPITTEKALAILERVNQSQRLMAQSLLKFEYGNAGFHTAQLHVGPVSVTDNTLLIGLQPEATQCKAQDLCGVVPETEGCSPGSGCC